jgi:hypothetical protein
MCVTCDLLCWITTILACMFVGLKSLVISLDYRSYMGSSARIWSLRWLFLYLCSYNLDGSVTMIPSGSSYWRLSSGSLWSVWSAWSSCCMLGCVTWISCSDSSSSDRELLFTSGRTDGDLDCIYCKPNPSSIYRRIAIATDRVWLIKEIVAGDFLFDNSVIHLNHCREFVAVNLIFNY